jgi:hypothetical protein
VKRIAEFVPFPIATLVVGRLPFRQRIEDLPLETRPPSTEIAPRHEVVDLDDGRGQQWGELTRKGALAGAGRAVDSDQPDAVYRSHREDPAARADQVFRHPFSSHHRSIHHRQPPVIGCYAL